MTFSLRTTHNGRHHWLAVGDKIDLEFEDGKGLSGRLGDVNVEPGGSAFSIIVTHNGQPLVREADLIIGSRIMGADGRVIAEAPDARPETPADGLRGQLTEADLVATPTNVLELLNSRTRQLERSRRHHDEKNEKLAKANERIRELEASLNGLSEDYQLVRQSLEQERTQKDRHFAALQGQRGALSEMRAERDGANAKLARLHHLTRQQLNRNEAQASEIRRLRTELRGRDERAQTLTVLEEKFAQASVGFGKVELLSDPPRVHNTTVVINVPEGASLTINRGE